MLAAAIAPGDGETVDTASQAHPRAPFVVVQPVLTDISTEVIAPPARHRVLPTAIVLQQVATLKGIHADTTQEGSA